MQTLARKSPLYLAAIAIGLAAAIVRECLVGFLAARPWPRWYIPWARAYKHLALELSWVVMSLLPSVLVAMAFGALLAKLLRGASTRFVLVTAGAWLAFDIGGDVIACTQICLHPVPCILEPFRLTPLASGLSLLVPAAALLSHSWVRSASAH
jgi:hypothetical protein